MKQNKEPEQSPDLFLLTVAALFGGFTLYMAVCVERFSRNRRDAYSPVAVYDAFEWLKASPLMPGGSNVTYYYCPIHTPGRDPEELWMQAQTYGWTEVRCPYFMAAVTAGTPSAQSTSTKETK